MEGASIDLAEVTNVVDDGDVVFLKVSTCTASAIASNITIKAKYVVAADGFYSTIRNILDIPFDGGEYDIEFITADCKLSSPGQLQFDAVQLFLSPKGFLLFVPQPNGIWRLAATVDQQPKEATAALYQKICDERLYAARGSVEIEDVVWTSRYHIHHRSARQFRKGRKFLAGDAAHVRSPAGGKGTNIGIQDVRDVSQ